MPLTQMSEIDYRLIRQLRRANVLENLTTNPIIERECVVAIFCADGHRFEDKYQHTKCFCGNNLHPLTRHGGALVLASTSPFAKKVRGGVTIHHDLGLLDEIEEAMQIKHTDQVLSFAHFPCAKAASANLTVADVLMLHVQAKLRVRREIPDCDITCLVHVDYNGWSGHKRFATYFLNRKNLCLWAQTADAAAYPALQQALAA